MERKYAKIFQSSGKKLLLPLDGFIEKLNKEFPNIAVLVNGKVKTRND